MLERSHWWLAAAVILIGTMVPFAVNETLGSEPSRIRLSIPGQGVPFPSHPAGERRWPRKS